MVEKAAKAEPEKPAHQARRAPLSATRRPGSAQPTRAGAGGRSAVAAKAAIATSQRTTAPTLEGVELTATVEALRKAFASTDAGSHRLGARMLGGIRDEDIGAIQRQWRQTSGVHLYTYLFDLSGKGVTKGVADALVLLRQAFARNMQLQTEFMSVYSDPKIIKSYAWQVHEYFAPFDMGDTLVRAEGQKGPSAGHLHQWEANTNEVYGLAALREHPKVILDRIDADFRLRRGIDIVGWIIANVPRTDASLRAIATLRQGDDRTLSVDVAATIIPPSHTNAGHVLSLLKSVPFAERGLIEKTFNHTFLDVGPYPGEKTPATLRGHLAKLEPAVLDPRAYQQILMLLRHEPTLAEELYLHLSGWAHTEHESALGVLQACVDKGIGRGQLEGDWERYVRSPIEKGQKPFTELGLRAQIGRAYMGDRKWQLLDSQAKRHIVALLEALGDGDDAIMSVETEGTPAERQLSERARDDSSYQAEERRIRAAYAVIKATESRVGADDQAIIRALDTIVRTHKQRVARLEGVAAVALKDATLDPDEQAVVARDYKAKAAIAREATAQVSRDLNRLVLNREYWIVEQLKIADDPSIKLSVSRREDARLMIVNGVNAADQVWIALRDNEDDALVNIVTKTWVQGGIDALHAAAAKPVLDPEGALVRPGFDIIDLIASTDIAKLTAPSSKFEGMEATPKKKTPRLPMRRALTLLNKTENDAFRGAGRIDVEVREGEAATNLQPIVDFFAQPGLKPELRDQVVTAYVDWKIPSNRRSRTFWNTAGSAFLSYMAAGHEGENTPQYVRLKELISPPVTAVEQAVHIAEVRAASKGGVLGGVARRAARLVSEIDGDFLGEAEQRSADRADFYARATPQQLEAMMLEAGVKTPQELAEHEAATFAARHGELHALENTCASLIAGLVETLVEAGLSPLTGGAGAAAVLGAALAAMASLAASEALMGPEFKLFCWENFNKVLSDSVGALLVEIDPRQFIVKKMPLASLGAHETFRQSLQNAAGGFVELAIGTAVDTTVNYLDRDKWPSSTDVAKMGDMVLGMAAAKIIGTQGTVRYNPGKYRAYMSSAERLTTNVIFKISLKTATVAKEVVSIMVANARDQTLADAAVQVMWKGARSVGGAVVKAGGSALGGAGTVRGQQTQIEQLSKARPDIFPGLVKAVARDHYDKSPELQAEHRNHSKGGRAMDPVEFTLWKIQQTDPPNKNSIIKLQSSMHNDLAAYAKPILQYSPTQGALAFRKPAQTLAEILKPIGPTVNVDAGAARTPDAHVDDARPAADVLKRLEARPGLGRTPADTRMAPRAVEAPVPTPPAVVKAAIGPALAEPPAAAKSLPAPTGPMARMAPAVPRGFDSEAQFLRALQKATVAREVASGRPAPLAAQGIVIDLATAKAWQLELATRLVEHWEPETRGRLEAVRAEVDRLSRLSSALSP